jgi:hypothetical protein
VLFHVSDGLDLVNLSVLHFEDVGGRCVEWAILFGSLGDTGDADDFHNLGFSVVGQNGKSEDEPHFLIYGAGSVEPPRNIPDILSSARLASAADSSPIYTTNFLYRTLAGKSYFQSSIKIPFPNLKSVTNQVVWIFLPATTTCMVLAFVKGLIRVSGEAFSHDAKGSKP